MKTISKLFLLIILVFSVSVFSLKAFGQKPNSIELKETKSSETECVSTLCEILRAEREYNEAFIAPGVESVDKLHTDDFFTTSENPARTTSKTDILNYLKNFGTRAGTVSSINTLDLKVRFYGQTAVATGIWKTTAISQNSKEVNKSERFTRVWVKENERWRLAASHYSTAFEPLKQQ
ncbi:MAG: nuclear transport factor 2 family protein [Acidobacteriota bacterium]|nr:nuclear transport factor 2 family protein [Acidobacteriota bacterium]